jgi:transcriptional regulator with XRE-family HTH domain
MSELVETVRHEFQDYEYRHAYVEECLNAMVATQIKVLREQRNMTQGQLAEAAGMKQPRIPLLEDSSYSNWTVNTLKRFARAFDVALSVKFEAFSSVIDDFANMSRHSLQRPTFANDARFQRRRLRRRRRHSRTRLNSLHRPYHTTASTTTAFAVSDVGLNALSGKKPPKREDSPMGQMLLEPKAVQMGGGR